MLLSRPASFFGILKRSIISLAFLSPALLGCNTGAWVRDQNAFSDVTMRDALSDDIPTIDTNFDRDVRPIETRDAVVVDRVFPIDPPRFCGPPEGVDAGVSADASGPIFVGGTPECPNDLRREGCPCPLEDIGREFPCWDGRRANRNRGICRDGVTRCERFSEIEGRFSACRGSVLPTSDRGPGSCQCFTSGAWRVANSAPCLLAYQDGSIHAVSTWLASDGSVRCPSALGPNPPPVPEPGQPWSTNSLNSDCEGYYELCLTLRAGDFRNPQASDCQLARRCTSTWYQTRGAPQTLPALDGWNSPDTACARAFIERGGYAEYSVRGQSAECDPLGTEAGQARVFRRQGYCSAQCTANRMLPGCEDCNREINVPF